MMIGKHRAGSVRLKRVLDVVISASALILLLPLLLLIALIVLAVHGRPVLLRQKRPGLFGRAFRHLQVPHHDGGAG